MAPVLCLGETVLPRFVRLERHHKRGHAMESTHSMELESGMNEFCVGQLSQSRASASPPRVKKISTAQAEELATKKKVVSAPKSAAGFLLMDSSTLRPLSFNAEAVQILGYPDDVAN